MRSLIFGLALATFTAAPVSAQQVWVTMDQVRSYSTDKAASSIIVGNPGIADIAVQDKNNFLLFGKAPGLTNIIIINEEGKTIENLQVRVNPPSSGMLVAHRGSNRTTYNCTFHCEATLTIGDNTAGFANVNNQVQSKLTQQSSGSSAPEIQGGPNAGGPDN